MPPWLSRLWLVLLPALTFLVWAAYFDQGGGGHDGGAFVRRPPVASPALPREVPLAPLPDAGREPGPELPGASRRDPTISVEVGKRHRSIGSAFSISPEGIWLTARHVVDGCESLGLFVGPRHVVPVSRAESHPNADVAILWSGRTAPALALSEAPLRVGQAGFHFGYPTGVPGQVVSTLLGRRNMRSVGRYSFTEPAVAWVEQRRVPEVERLGGMSGGPTLNRTGAVVGVTTAESPRRGRVITAAPESLRELLVMSGAAAATAPAAAAAAGPEERDFVAYGDRLRAGMTVAKVYCDVDEPARRPLAGRL